MITGNLHLHINQVPEQGCAELWGRFPLLPGTTPRAGQSVTVQPGASYQETFLMERTALNENYKPNPFELAAGHTYTHFLEFRHPVSYWLYLSVAARGEFKIR